MRPLSPSVDPDFGEGKKKADGPLSIIIHVFEYLKKKPLSIIIHVFEYLKKKRFVYCARKVCSNAPVPVHVLNRRVRNVVKIVFSN
jgi:hypothetical protein